MKGVHKLAGKDKSLLRSSLLITDETVIIDELISNSIDANAEQIIITIDLKCHSITVIDNGDGISFHNLEQIGPRYYSNKGLAYSNKRSKNNKSSKNKNKTKSKNSDSNDNTNDNIIDPTQGITSLGYRGEALASIAQVMLIIFLIYLQSFGKYIKKNNKQKTKRKYNIEKKKKEQKKWNKQNKNKIK